MKKEKYYVVCDDSKMGIMPKMTPEEKKQWEKDCILEAKRLETMAPLNSGTQEPRHFPSRRPAFVSYG